jgi:thiol-disulfide isomerase/thioredoxin
MFKDIIQYIIDFIEYNSVFFMIGSLIIIPIIIFFLLISLNKSESFSYVPYKEMIYFSMPGCRYCEKMQPTFDLLLKNYGKIKGIKLKQIISSKNPKLVEKYNIQSFPTILYIREGKVVNEYKGDRSYNDLLNFMKKSMTN